MPQARRAAVSDLLAARVHTLTFRRPAVPGRRPAGRLRRDRLGSLGGGVAA